MFSFVHDTATMVSVLYGTLVNAKCILDIVPTWIYFSHKIWYSKLPNGSSSFMSECISLYTVNKKKRTKKTYVDTVRCGRRLKGSTHFSYLPEKINSNYANRMKCKVSNRLHQTYYLRSVPDLEGIMFITLRMHFHYTRRVKRFYNVKCRIWPVYLKSV